MFVVLMVQCPPGNGPLGQYYSPLFEVDTLVTGNQCEPQYGPIHANF